jgi:hypothetical protein
MLLEVRTVTKKHFVEFAEYVRIEYAGKPELARAAANAFVYVARRDNPRFDVDRFLKACGVSAQ